MILDELKEYFGSCYQFKKKTNFHHSCYLNWEKKGYIPIKTQIKLEHLTGGELKANLDHLGRGFDDRDRIKGIRGIEAL